MEINKPYGHSLFYEYTRLTVIYKDDTGKQYKSIFEGDRDGLKPIGLPVL